MAIRGPAGPGSMPPTHVTAETSPARPLASSPKPAPLDAVVTSTRPSGVPDVAPHALAITQPKTDMAAALREMVTLRGPLSDEQRAAALAFSDRVATACA